MRQLRPRASRKTQHPKAPSPTRPTEIHKGANSRSSTALNIKDIPQPMPRITMMAQYRNAMVLSLNSARAVLRIRFGIVDPLPAL